MRETLKRLTKMTAGYGMVQWAGPIVSLIFTPIITRFLDPADYGIQDYVLTISSAVGIGGAAGTAAGARRHTSTITPPTRPGSGALTGSALIMALVFELCGWAVDLLPCRAADRTVVFWR